MLYTPRNSRHEFHRLKIIMNSVSEAGQNLVDFVIKETGSVAIRS
jgi:hypothetical protein